MLRNAKKRAQKLLYTGRKTYPDIHKNIDTHANNYSGAISMLPSSGERNRQKG